MTPRIHYDAAGPREPQPTEWALAPRSAPVETFCGIEMVFRDRWVTSTWTRVTCRRCRRKGGR